MVVITLLRRRKGKRKISTFNSEMHLQFLLGDEAKLELPRLVYFMGISCLFARAFKDKQ